MKKLYRNQTKEIRIGDVVIGGNHPVAIQSMTNTRTEDVKGTVEQIHRLEKAGCEIIRCTVPTREAAEALKEIKKQIHIPLVADIHFDYRLAIAAIENGADKIRINPGNIGTKERVQAVVDKAKEYGVPIRVGVNSGSLEKPLIEKYGGVTAEGIVESALDKVHMIEEMGYDNLVVSIKSSDVLMCVKAHELIAEQCPYPLHVGITESGTVYSGNVKSSVGLGIILYEGIGNTIRVSLTGVVLITANREPYRSLCAQKVPGRTLLDRPFILREPTSGTRQAMEDYLRRCGLSREVLHPVAEIDNPEAIKSSVSRGIGVSVVSQLSVREELAGGKLLSFDLDAEGVFRKIYLTWRKDTALTMVEQRFIDYVRKSARKIG